jgi:hypothetical protein
LIEIKRRIDSAEGQAIGLGDAVDIVGPDDVPRSGHVLHDDGWVPGNILDDVTCREPRPEIVAAAHGGSDDHGDGFALIEGRLGRRLFKVQWVKKFKE